MQLSAQQIFKELEEGHFRPFYVVVGEEPFQTDEILHRLKAFVLRNEGDEAFNYEAWDGEHVDGAALAASLDTLPGLFSDEGAVRLICCSRFDKASSTALEALDAYFHNPSPTTIFLMLCAKVDKRKGWYKRIDEKGAVIEVGEPYEREWPRWHSYFEKKIGKKIDSEAWERLLEASSRRLSLLWAELTKVATFAGERPTITGEDLRLIAASNGDTDVFDFAEEVLCRRIIKAMESYHLLLKEGENEIKLLSILVRQFRMVSHYLELAEKGVTDSKRLGAELGTHPFFISKIQQQAKHQAPKPLSRALALLADCDYRLKTGEGSLFEHFLVPYFSTGPACQ